MGSFLCVCVLVPYWDHVAQNKVRVVHGRMQLGICMRRFASYVAMCIKKKNDLPLLTSQSSKSKECIDVNQVSGSKV